MTIERNGALAAERANHLVDQGKHRKAVASYKDAFDQGEYWVARNIGNSYVLLKEWSHAAEWFQRAVQLGDSGGRYNLGFVYEVVGRLDDAIAAYSEAAQSGDSKGTLAVAVILHGRGEERLARSKLESLFDDDTAVDGIPMDTYARAIEVLWDWELTRDLDLEKKLEAVRHVVPASRVYLAEIALARNDSKRAFRLLHHGCAAGDAECCISLGNLYESRGKLSRAEKAYAAGAKLGDRSSLTNLGALQCRTGRQRKGLRNLRRAATQGDDLASTLLAKYDR